MTLTTAALLAAIVLLVLVSWACWRLLVDRGRLLLRVGALERELGGRARVGTSRLLYVTCATPQVTGHGTAIRAGLVLEGLARRHTVHLRVVTSTDPADVVIPERFASVCEEVVVGPLAAPIGDGEPYDVVHVFRVAALRAARGELARAGRRQLDLDEVESSAGRRIAALLRSNGDGDAAARQEHEAARLEEIERRALRELDTVLVCSSLEAERLPSLPGERAAAVRIVPNGLRRPMRQARRRGPSGPSELLFVGLLTYYPNHDAVAWFGDEVLPRINDAAARPVRLTVVGGGASPGLGTAPNVRLAGYVPDPAPWYAEADAVVIPLRAAGGTRIKAIEAFAHRRPVVSTSIGVEGLDARSGQHVLVGDTADELAMACLRLIDEPQLADGLAAAGFALFNERYEAVVVAKAIAALD